MVAKEPVSRTDGIDLVMLEQRPDHTVADHNGRDTKRYELQSSEPVETPVSHRQPGG